MFRSIPRTALRAQRQVASLSSASARISGKRFLTTEAPHKASRSWKNTGLRWGIAAAGIYFYNTSPVFAEHPQSNLLNPNLDAIDIDHDEHQTIDRLLESSKTNTNKKQASVLQSAVEESSEKAAEQSQQNALDAQQDAAQSIAVAEPAAEGAAELEAEAAGEGAFNPVTGEINWDCPCLGGMAYGPCGEEFRAAFSCFVYSNEEPKGMECIDKFGAMQDCFRAHPEVYKGELEDDETLDDELAVQKEELEKEIQERRQQIHEKTQTSSDASQQAATATKSTASSKNSVPKETENDSSKKPSKKSPAKKADQSASAESDLLVPKAAHDATETKGAKTQAVAKDA